MYRITKCYYGPITFYNYPTILQTSNSILHLLSLIEFIFFVNQEWEVYTAEH